MLLFSRTHRELPLAWSWEQVSKKSLLLSLYLSSLRFFGLPSPKKISFSLVFGLAKMMYSSFSKMTSLFRQVFAFSHTLHSSRCPCVVPACHTHHTDPEVAHGQNNIRVNFVPQGPNFCTQHGQCTTNSIGDVFSMVQACQKNWLVTPFSRTSSQRR